MLLTPMNLGGLRKPGLSEQNARGGVYSTHISPTERYGNPRKNTMQRGKDNPKRPSDCDGGVGATPIPEPIWSEEFVRLFAAHDRRIFSYILALVRNETAAEDVFSETSVVLWREFPKFRSGEDFPPWALAIAFNQVRKWRRQRGRDRLVFSDALIAELAKDAAIVSEQFDARREALGHCVGELSDRKRQVLTWFYESELSAGEIAERWGLTVHAVYKSLKTTRRILLQCIEKQLASGKA